MLLFVALLHLAGICLLLPVARRVGPIFAAACAFPMGLLSWVVGSLCLLVAAAEFTAATASASLVGPAALALYFSAKYQLIGRREVIGAIVGFAAFLALA